MTLSSSIGRPETRFVNTPRGAIGYQVFGSEARDLVYITNWVTNVDMYCSGLFFGVGDDAKHIVDLIPVDEH